MNWPSPNIFSDVANALGIAHPAVVEKDFFGIQLLKLIQQVKSKDYELIFAGGTCLAKAHCKIYRMSEDIDIKLVPTETALNLSRGKQRSNRKRLYQTLVSLLDSSKIFSLISEPLIRNEYRYQQFLIGYPSQLDKVDALRSHLQLELTESASLQNTIASPIASMYANVAQIEPEINLCICVGLESIAAEKLVSLLRRTAAFIRNSAHPDDPTLIRHLYDLNIIVSSDLNEPLFRELVQKVIQIDAEHFSHQHPNFKEDPETELRIALKHIQTDTRYQKRYLDFIGPLVYHPEPILWEQALEKFLKIANSVLTP